MKKLAMLAAALLLSACGQTSAGGKTELFVSSASSLAEVMKAAEKEFAKTHPETELVFNFSSSSKLGNQIKQGAPVDLFLSASEKDMEMVLDQGLIHKNSITPFAGNELVLASAEKLPDTDAEALLNGAEGLIAIGEPESVPLGIYSKQALSRLGLWEALDGRMIYAKDARQVLSYVESGNADIGIVYASDAGLSDAIKTSVPLKNEGMEIIYPAAVLEDSENKAAAEAFLAFLSGPDGQRLLKEYGFLPIEEAH